MYQLNVNSACIQKMFSLVLLNFCLASIGEWLHLALLRNDRPLIFLVVLQVHCCKQLTLEPDQTEFLLAVGESVQINCVCSQGGQRNVEVFWQFDNGNKVPRRNNRNRDRAHRVDSQNQRNSTLVIPDLTDRWTGEYQCEASRVRLIKTITINIVQPPGKWCTDR